MITLVYTYILRNKLISAQTKLQYKPQVLLVLCKNNTGIYKQGLLASVITREYKTHKLPTMTNASS